MIKVWRDIRSRACLFALALMCLAVADGAEAQQRRHHGNGGSWHDNWENRRDARRAAVVTRVVVGGMVRSGERAEAREHYRECVYATGYDYDCERMRYYEDHQARRSARRAGVVAGAIAYGIVRD